MPLRQAHFTVCEKGVIPGTRGYAFSASSPGWEVNVLREIEGVSGYKLVREMERRLGEAISKGEDIAPIIHDAPKTLQFRRTATGLNILSRIVYLGMADRRRLGNLFAHSLYTADVRDIGQMQPAQMWEAAFWEEKEREVSELSILNTLDPVTAFSLEDLLGFCRRSEHRGHAIALLSAILSCLLDETKQRRVLIVDRPENVARWIALAGLILPLSLVHHLTFTTYTGEPDRTQDCNVVGTLPGAPGLQLNSPGFRFNYWIFSFITGEFSDDPPSNAYVDHVLAESESTFPKIPNGFLQWADQAIRESAALRTHLFELLRFYIWLDKPTAEGEEFETALCITKTILVRDYPSVLPEVWDRLQGPMTPHRIIAATALAKVQASAQHEGNTSAQDVWWKVVGCHLGALEADQLQDVQKELSAAGLNLSFLHLTHRSRMQDLLHGLLAASEGGLDRPLALLGFLTGNDLLRDPASAEIREFLKTKVLTLVKPDQIGSTIHHLDSSRSSAVLIRCWAGVLDEALRQKSLPASSFSGILCHDAILPSRLGKLALEDKLIVLYAGTQACGKGRTFVDVVGEVWSASKQMKTGESETVAALDVAYELFQPPIEISSGDAKKITSMLGAGILGRCEFASLLQQAIQQEAMGKTENEVLGRAADGTLRPDRRPLSLRSHLDGLRELFSPKAGRTPRKKG